MDEIPRERDLGMPILISGFFAILIASNFQYCICLKVIRKLSSFINFCINRISETIREGNIFCIYKKSV